MNPAAMKVARTIANRIAQHEGSVVPRYLGLHRDFCLELSLVWLPKGFPRRIVEMCILLLQWRHGLFILLL